MSDQRLPRRPLGGTGLFVTPLGLAELAVSHSWRRRKLSPDEVEGAFHQHGINAFLVGGRYGRLSEGVRRLIRAGHRDELVLVGGVGLPFAGSVRRALDRHLQMLETDHLDVWLIGWVCGQWYARDSVWTEMRRLREEGKTRAIAFSSHNRALAARLARELPADVAMIRYNASHRGAEREVFEALADLGDRRPGVIAYTATRWGMLLEPQPKRGFPEAMTAPECYRFALGHPTVDMVWCAAGTPEELREDALGVLEGPLPPARREAVCRFGDAVHETARRGRRWMFGSTSA